MAEVLDIIGENPLGAVINLKAKNIEGYKTIIEFLESDVIQAKYLSIIDSTNYNENKYVIGKITTLIKYITIIGLGVAGILIFISLIIIYNTIRLIIYSYKEEIQVMRLIGASNFYTRGPFLIEGILYGLISGIFSIFAT
ncbi:MAG TPA: FtsX-like permease family protein [Candidatus Pacebacteria bacterium]|nr:FtsX-like permease family protein [Candidatus Paceibacterota bacterium]